MDGIALQRCASARADELPGAALSHPFGEEWDVYKVCGKVFMLHAEVRGQRMVTLKAQPADARVLCEAFAEITPGYHMNKRHWVTVYAGDAIDAGLLTDLVTESYLLVLENSVPKVQWPVDPSTFGRSDQPARP